jgi:hypothetical protein
MSLSTSNSKDVKQFIRITLWFALAFCAMQIVLNGFVLKGMGHPFAHNTRFATKYAQYKQSEDQYNTIFIGSSRIYREIDPTIIDSTLSDFNFKSYNLGASATFIPESYYLYEKLIENKSSPTALRFVFVELNDITPIKLVNWFAPQSYYYLDERYIRVVWENTFDNSHMNVFRKAELIYPYLQGYLLKHLILLPRWRVKSDPEIFLGPDQNGFYPLDLEIQQQETPRLVERRDLFLADTTIIQRRISAQLQEVVAEASEDYIQFLNSLIHKADDQGVSLYFIIPPKLKNYTAVKAMSQHLQHGRVVDMGSYQSYPDLYDIQYWFDQGHFNSEGAELYSAYLAEAIRDAIRDH